MYIYHIFQIKSSVDGHLCCFHILAIVNRAALNTQVHVSFLRKVLSGYMPKSGIAGSYGSSIFFPLYSKGIKLSLHVDITITFFSLPFVLLQREYLDKVLNATQQDLLVNLF